MIAFYVLSVLHQYSTLVLLIGNPDVFGVQIVLMLNIIGMILLCGMFKDAVLSSRYSRYVVTSKNKVGPSAPKEQRQELKLIIDSHAYSEQVVMPEESS